MSLFKELAKELIDRNPPGPPIDYDIEELKLNASLPQEPCVKHHWLDLPENERCRFCQMKFSYWKDMKRAADKGNVNLEDWSCKPHYHSSAPRAKMEEKK